MFKIIYFLTPYYVTGGTENIQQVCSVLNDFNFNSSIIYDNGSMSHPDKFIKYNNKISGSQLNDNNNALLVLPEYYPMSKFEQFKNIQKAVFWLSVDNSPDIKRRIDIAAEADKYGIRFHFAQSEYAFQVLKSYGLKNVYHLSDYISDEYFLTSIPDISIKKPQVVYNPAKGLVYTNMLINNNIHNIKFIPIINMTTQQIIKILDESMVYIDFGNHPGKDRIPREAALRNCIVMTNKSGSAANDIDIPIPAEYKFSEFNTYEVFSRINMVFKNYRSVLSDFIFYIQNISIEKQKLIYDCKNVFTNLI